jgi:hypothetical protein
MKGLPVLRSLVLSEMSSNILDRFNGSRAEMALHRVEPFRCIMSSYVIRADACCIRHNRGRRLVDFRPSRNPIRIRLPCRRERASRGPTVSKRAASSGFSFPSDDDEKFRGGRGKRVNRPPLPISRFCAPTCDLLRLRFAGRLIRSDPSRTLNVGMAPAYFSISRTYLGTIELRKRGLYSHLPIAS